MQLTKEILNSVTVVTLIGDALDANNVKEFKREMTPVLMSSYKVVFDMSKLQFVDSSGIGVILACLRNLNAEGGDLKLCAMTKPVRALFELVRMHRIFDIFNTTDEAVAAFS